MSGETEDELPGALDHEVAEDRTLDLTCPICGTDRYCNCGKGLEHSEFWEDDYE